MWRKLVPVLIVLAVALAFTATKWSGAVPWSGPDQLFYQAQSLEVRGDSPSVARQKTFDGPPGRAALAYDRRLYPTTASKLESASWVRYSSRFYRRRWVVPGMTAGLNPLFGERSLEVASILGYIATGLLLYALLRRRFSATTSVVVSCVCLYLPPLRQWSFVPATDSWGLALLLLSLIAAALVLDRGERWLALWVATLAVLSITRETYLVALIAALWIAVWTRTRRTAWLLVSGLCATLPASLLIGPSLRESMAYIENGFNPPPNSGWGFVFSHYWPSLRTTVRDDVLFPHESGWSAPHAIVWYAGVAVILLGVALLILRRDGDPFFGLIRGSLLGAAVLIAITVNYTALRLELVFVPAVAVGLALLWETVVVPLLPRMRPSSGGIARA